MFIANTEGALDQEVCPQASHSEKGVLSKSVIDNIQIQI